MSLYKTILIDSQTTAYIWKVEESLGELCDDIGLTAHCKKRFDSMKSQIHQRAFMSIRHLFAQAGYTDFDLYYDDQGKPHLKDGTHISITHSHEFTAVILSKNKEVGIDIELQRDKILRIASKFTPIEEYRTLANSDAVIRKLTIVWGAKESLYKIYGTPGLSFLNHIYVEDFDFDDGCTQATITYQKDQSDYAIFYLEFEGYTCVYAYKNSKLNNMN